MKSDVDVDDDADLVIALVGVTEWGVDDFDGAAGIESP